MAILGIPVPLLLVLLALPILGGLALREYLQAPGDPQTGDTPENGVPQDSGLIPSDARPPKELLLFLEVIDKASASAPAEVQKTYFMEGLSRSETLARESSRMIEEIRALKGKKGPNS